jgi:hypothetical protein
VARVVDGRALLWRLVGGAEEDPLLRRRHLRAGQIANIKVYLQNLPDCVVQRNFHR